MIQLATSPALLVGMPGDLLPQPGERPQLFVPTTADLFRLDPLLADKVTAESEAGCWLWTGATVRAGNGRVPYGSLRRSGAHWLAHRWIYVLVVGPIEADRQIHHECATPLCVNPAHLDALDPDDHSWIHREAAAYADDEMRAHRRRALLDLTHPTTRPR